MVGDGSLFTLRGRRCSCVHSHFSVGEATVSRAKLIRGAHVAFVAVVAILTVGVGSCSIYQILFLPGIGPDGSALMERDRSGLYRCKHSLRGLLAWCCGEHTPSSAGLFVVSDGDAFLVRCKGFLSWLPSCERCRTFCASQTKAEVRPFSALKNKSCLIPPTILHPSEKPLAISGIKILWTVLGE